MWYGIYCTAIYLKTKHLSEYNFAEYINFLPNLYPFLYCFLSKIQITLKGLTHDFSKRVLLSCSSLVPRGSDSELVKGASVRVYTSKDKQKVLARAIKDKQNKISLWKDEQGVWHAALGASNVPNWAVEVEHIR